MQVRDTAERMSDMVSKQMMLMIADDYDRLSDAIERELLRRERAKPKAKRRQS